MQNNPNQQENGFTIVELLIVIVVIAILAAITIVAYNGIQERATASKTESTVSSTLKLLEHYKTYEGDYPTHQYNETVCLGPPDDYPATPVFEAGECATWVRWGSNRYSHSVDTTMNAQFQTTLRQIPPGSIGLVSVPELELEYESLTDVHYRGLLLRTSSEWDGDLEETVTHSYVHYFLNGTRDCTQGTAFTYDDITECIISLDGVPIPEYLPKSNGGEG